MQEAPLIQLIVVPRIVVMERETMARHATMVTFSMGMGAVLNARLKKVLIAFKKVSDSSKNYADLYVEMGSASLLKSVMMAIR